MKICIFSDSHGRTKNMIAAIELEKPDTCFFLGDGERDFDAVKSRYPAMKTYSVQGNCDMDSFSRNSLITEIDGVSIYATHGHNDDVKWEDDFHTLVNNAREAGAAVALFGHTHEQHLSEREGLTLINPGSAGYGSYPSYAVLEIDKGRFSAELKAL